MHPVYPCLDVAVITIVVFVIIIVIIIGIIIGIIIKNSMNKNLSTYCTQCRVTLYCGTVPCSTVKCNAVRQMMRRSLQHMAKLVMYGTRSLGCGISSSTRLRVQADGSSRVETNGVQYHPITSFTNAITRAPKQNKSRTPHRSALKTPATTPFLGVLWGPRLRDTLLPMSRCCCRGWPWCKKSQRDTRRTLGSSGLAACQKSPSFPGSAPYAPYFSRPIVSSMTPIVATIAKIIKGRSRHTFSTRNQQEVETEAGAMTCAGITNPPVIPLVAVPFEETPFSVHKSPPWKHELTRRPTLVQGRVIHNFSVSTVVPVTLSRGVGGGSGGHNWKNSQCSRKGTKEDKCSERGHDKTHGTVRDGRLEFEFEPSQASIRLRHRIEPVDTPTRSKSVTTRGHGILCSRPSFT